MPRVLVRCDTCKEDKYVSKRHRDVMGRICEECLLDKLKKEAEQCYLEDIGYWG